MTTNLASFESRLEAHARRVETHLSTLLGSAPDHGEIARPERLVSAMRHAVLNGGKRLRPFLVLESAALFSADPEAALQVAAALECIHCYSLVHDDLPAMDDDDLRRGQPTVHIAYDEATAILAGDALLTLAFELIVRPQARLAPALAAPLVLALAQAAGLGGMAGGQMLDLEAERHAPDEAGIVTLQAMKTGALLRFAAEAGALLAGAPAEDQARLRRFGETIGLAFQLADDLLDLRADAATMGKATGKDAARGKGTLVSLKGEAWAEARLSALVREASDCLAPYGAQAGILIDCARFIAERSH